MSINYETKYFESLELRFQEPLTHETIIQSYMEAEKVRVHLEQTVSEQETKLRKSHQESALLKTALSNKEMENQSALLTISGLKKSLHEKDLECVEALQEVADLTMAYQGALQRISELEELLFKVYENNTPSTVRIHKSPKPVTTKTSANSSDKNSYLPLDNSKVPMNINLKDDNIEIVISKPKPIQLELTKQESYPKEQQNDEELQKTLISWTAIFKDTRPSGTLSSLTALKRKRIDESVFEFLRNKKLPKDMVDKCFVKEGKKKEKNVAALPPEYIDEFNSWLDERIDAGMLHLVNLKENAPISQVSAVELNQRGDLISWSDLANTKYRNEMEEIVGRDFNRRVEDGVSWFIREHAHRAGKKPSDCFIQKPGETNKSIAIPVSLKDLFLDWFSQNLKNLFYDFETNLATQVMDERKIKEEVV